MIGPELSFKTVCGMTKRRRHHPRVSDDYVEGFTLGQESFGASAHTLQIAEVELDHFKASTVLGCILPDLSGRGLSLSQIPGSAHDVCAMRGQRTSCLYPNSSRNSGDQ